MTRPAAPLGRSWDAAMTTGLVRLAAGALLVSSHRRIVRVAGAAADDRLTDAVFLAFGVRDAALGVSAVAASRPGRDVRRQLWLQAGFDAVDAAACAALIATGRLPRVRGAACMAAALGGGVLELATSRKLPQDIPARATP